MYYQLVQDHQYLEVLNVTCDIGWIRALALIPLRALSLSLELVLREGETFGSILLIILFS
jgi:hypothetical protein